jgi:hypothetical protein
MGIEHNGEGSVEGELPKELDPEKLQATADALYAAFNPRIVSLYLQVFNLQTLGGWKSLTELLASDERVKLGNEPAPQPEHAPEPPTEMESAAEAAPAEPEAAPQAEPVAAQDPAPVADDEDAASRQDEGE